MGKQRDPFTVPMMLCRVGWMTSYQGMTGGDSITGGGAYVAEHGFGHEIFNFREFKGSIYGYVQPPPRRQKWAAARINVTRLGADPGDDSVDGVLVVWVATSPSGGAYVVGWYRNATVFRNWQRPPAGCARRHGNERCGYYITARADDAILLTPDARVFPVPQSKAGGFGKVNLLYADAPDKHGALRLDVLKYVESGRVRTARSNGTTPLPCQPDPLMRQRVEQTAVRMTTAHYARLGYAADSVEKDNMGWDLDATLGRRVLRLEVKGLSGSQVVVDLTPNEYAAMQKFPDTYRICVVTAALAAPRLEVFARAPDSGKWESTIIRGAVLAVREVVAARCTAS